MRRTLTGLLALGISLSGIVVVVSASPAAADTPPVAGNPTVTVPENPVGKPLHFNFEGPPVLTTLVTDTNTGAQPYTVQLVSSPADGALTLNGDNSFLYTPNAGFVGVDSFTFTVTDSLGYVSNVATAYLDVGFYFATTALPPATRLVPYSFTLSAPGGTTPYRWVKVAGSSKWPSGMRFYGKTGTLAGTPGKHAIAGTYTFSFKVYDNSRPRQIVYSPVLTLVVS